MTLSWVVLGWPLLLELSPALIAGGFYLSADAGVTVSFLFLLGACIGFCSSDLAHTHYPLPLAALPVGIIYPGQTGFAIIVVGFLLLVFECPALALIRQNYAELFTLATDSMRSFFAQDAHMQVFKFILDCLDFLHV